MEATAKRGKLRPIQRAAINNNPEMIELLTSSGAKVNSRNFEKKTPLIMAAWEGNLDAINALLDANAEVDEPERTRKKTPLHFAAWAGQIDAVKLLHSRGADVNYVARRGRTALFHATMLDSLAAANGTEIITYLVENGAKDAASLLTTLKTEGLPSNADEETYRALYDAMVVELERLVEK